ncbi:MAG: YdgA family protein [Betaproteobacteria bacterium]|nr:YdgA family protein [Betaproteobacteria bacterium]
MSIGSRGKIVGAVALAVVVLVGATYWTGIRVEKRFRESVDLAAKNGLAVSMVDYQRGIFGATARTDVVFQIPSGENSSITGSVTVPIIHNIRHGPLPALTAAARIHSEAQLTEDVVAQFKEIFDGNLFEGKTPLVLDIVVGWLGGQHLRMVSPKAEAIIKENKAKVFWGGLDGEFVMDSDLTYQKADVVIDGLSFIENDGDILQVGRTVLKSDTNRPKGFEFINTGMTNIALEKFHFRGKVDNGAVYGIEFENFHAVANASIKDGALGMEVKFDANKIITEGEKKEVIDSPRLAFQLENVDAKAIDATVQSMMNNQNGQEGQDGLEQLEQKTMMLLLQRKPAFAIQEARGGWPEGVAALSFRIAYVGDGNTNTLAEDNLSSDLQMTLPRALVIRHLSSQVSKEITDALEDGEENEVNVEKETTEQVKKQMDMLLEKGIFVEKGDVLSVEGHLRNGELNLNGKPQPPMILFELIPPFILN